LWVAELTGTTLECTGMADRPTIEIAKYTPSTASSTNLTARGTSRPGSADSSAMLEIVSMPV